MHSHLLRLRVHLAPLLLVAAPACSFLPSSQEGLQLAAVCAAYDDLRYDERVKYDAEMLETHQVADSLCELVAVKPRALPQQ